MVNGKEQSSAFLHLMTFIYLVNWASWKLSYTLNKKLMSCSLTHRNSQGWLSNTKGHVLHNYLCLMQCLLIFDTVSWSCWFPWRALMSEAHCRVFEVWWMAGLGTHCHWWIVPPWITQQSSLTRQNEWAKQQFSAVKLFDGKLSCDNDKPRCHA